ncbi:MAG: hypothetical protein ACI80V_000689 [Rhodothermales bacterium]|jgi:hypothetical protein
MRSLVLASTLGLLLTSCGTESGPLPLGLTLEQMAVPTDSLSGEPYLVSSGGEVALSWMDKTETGAAMRFASLGEGGWNPPHAIASGDNWFVNWADVPSIAIAGGTMWAHWLEYNGDGRYSYGVRVSSSDDGGDTWTTPTWLHDDEAPVEHGFGAMTAIGNEVHAVWLDGRQGPENPQMSVRTRSLGSDGAGFGADTLLDERTCDCCPNDIVAVGDDGLVAAYRNRSADEVRDIHVIRYADGAWQEPKAVHEDGWQIAACPVNGPALASADGRVAIAWFTAPEDAPQVNVAFSEDGGESFGAPIRMDTGPPTGRVDIVMLEDGTAVVSWIQASSSAVETPPADAPQGRRRPPAVEAGIMARRVSADGRTSDPVVVIPTSTSRSSGYPRMVKVGNDLVFAWTGLDPVRSVQSARATLQL